MTFVKPCPFCGAEVSIYDRNGRTKIDHPDGIECILNVMESQWYGPIGDFIREWNRRVEE
jgi:hypothetical protein